GQDHQFFWLRVEAARRLDELHERLRIHRRGEHPKESPNRPRKRKRDARLDVHPADIPPASDQRSGQCIGDLAQLSGLRIEVHDRARGVLLGRPRLRNRGHGWVSDAAAADTAVRCMNETTNRPDSGTMHSRVSPSLIRPSVIISSRMTKMAALPMFPTFVRLLYHISGRPVATWRRESSPNTMVFIGSLEQSTGNHVTVFASNLPMSRRRSYSSIPTRTRCGNSESFCRGASAPSAAAVFCGRVDSPRAAAR